MDYCDIELFALEMDRDHSVVFETAPKYCILEGFPDSSVGKEFTCNAGDSSSIPRSGRSAGEGIGYPLQYSWVSLVAQLVKNLLAMRKTWVQSLGWEDPLENGMATHSSILAENSIDSIVHRVTKSRTRLSKFHFHCVSDSCDYEGCSISSKGLLPTVVGIMDI